MAKEKEKVEPAVQETKKSAPPPKPKLKRKPLL